MAEGGIDRKADEKIQFSTSKEVTVHPTFESMSLKGKSMARQRWLCSSCMIQNTDRVLE
jgi:hypothetical protein